MKSTFRISLSKLSLTLACILTLILSVPVLALQSGNAQGSSDPVLDSIINQKQSEQEEKAKALNTISPASSSSDQMLQELIIESEKDQ